MSFAGDPARTKKQAEKNAAMAAWSSLKQSTSSACQARKDKSFADLYASQSIINGPRRDLCSAGGSQGARRWRRAGARGCRQSARRAEATRRRRRQVGVAASAEAQRQRLVFLCSSEPVAVQTPMAASEHLRSAAEDWAPAATGRPKDPASPPPAAATGVRLQGGRRGGRAGADAGAGHGAGQGRGRRGGNATFAVLLRACCCLGVPPRRLAGGAENIRRGRVPRPGCERAVGDPGVRRPAAAAASAGQGGTEWPGDALGCVQEGVSTWSACE